MTPEVEQRFERIEALLAETVASQAKTEAIANSNARAIEALGNKVSDLIGIVGEFAQSTNARLTML